MDSVGERDAKGPGLRDKPARGASNCDRRLDRCDVGDPGAMTASGRNETGRFELAVCTCDGPTGDAQVSRQLPDCREPITSRHRSARDEAGKLFAELLVRRNW
jgi:hypothetical protein